MREQRLTLAVVQRGGEVLLGRKKRGFGQGFWNGFGGKVRRGEPLESAARREVWEECRLDVTRLTPCGRLRFTFADGTMGPLLVYVFRVLAWRGEPTETEEMAPRWFARAKIPYDEMWPDDRHWLPQVLAGGQVEGVFHFDYEGQLKSFDVREVADVGESWHT